MTTLTGYSDDLNIDVGSEEDDSFDVVYFKDGLKWCLFAETNQYNVVVSTAQK